ncbi:MAG: hypothetical protein Q8N13_11035 [Acidovorax sp.]|nr:hypothetical protein [Acidovorax sp.]
MKRIHTLALVACIASSLWSFSASANEAHRRISAMDETQRQEYFSVFLYRSEERCGLVTRTFFQGLDKKGDAYWNLACANGKSYMVSIANDAKGSSKILGCEFLKAINAGSCFKKFR